jgi:hypothetical protein
VQDRVRFLTDQTQQPNSRFALSSLLKAVVRFLTDQTQQPNTTGNVTSREQSRIGQASGTNHGTMIYNENKHFHHCPLAAAPSFTTQTLPKKENPLPPLLPYMVDRDTQESQIIEAIEKHVRQGTQRPFICIVHGDEEHCVRQFVQVFQDKLIRGKLHKELNIKQPLWHKITNKSEYFYVKDVSFPFAPPSDLIKMFLNELDRNFPSSSAKEIANIFLSAASNEISNNIEENMVIKKQAINKKLIGKIPWLLIAPLEPGTIQTHGVDIIDKFLEFWDDWVLERKQTLLVFLYIDNLSDLSHKKYLESLSCEKDRANCVVLSIEEHIVHQHITNWLILKEVKKYLGIHHTNFSNDLKSDKLWKELKKDTPMATVAKQLKRLLEKHKA